MKSRKTQIAIVVIIMILAAFARLIPHAPNFTPVIAIAIFGAFVFKNKNLAILLPLAVLFFSDILLEIGFQLGFRSYTGFYSGMIFTYAAFILIALLAYVGLKKINVLKIGIGAFLASALFFLISNLGVWATGSLYTLDFSGLIACYTAAIPFFHNTLLSTLLYSGVLFGAYYLINQQSLTPAFQKLNSER